MLLIVLTLGALAPPVAAHVPGVRVVSGSPLVRLWSTEQGLPNNSLFDLCLSRDGALWLATLEGLARFDGSEFEVFNETTSPGMSTNRLLSVLESREGDIWAGSEASGLMHFRGERWTRYDRRTGLPGNRVRDLHEDAQGTLWVATDHGLARGGREGFRPVALPAPWHDQEVLRLSPDPHGWLWVTFLNGVAPVAVDPGGRLLRGPTERLSGYDACIVQVDCRGSLWVGCWTDGLWKLDSRGLEKPVHVIGKETVKSMVCDPDGGVWVGGDRDLYRVSAEGAAERILSNNGEGRFISLLADADHNLWVGYERIGLLRVGRPLVRMHTTGLGGDGEIILSLADDRQGGVYVGTNGGGPLHWKDGRFTRITAEVPLASWEGGQGEASTGTDSSRTIPLQYIWAVLCDRRGRLWMGTERYGLWLKDGEGLIPLRGGHEGNPLTVRCLMEDRSGNVWAGDQSGALTRFDPQGAVRTFGPSDGLPGTAVISLREGRDRAIWVGTIDRGVYRLEGGRFRAVGDHPALAGADVRVVRQYPDGTLLVGTYGRGLFVISGGRTVRLSSREGFPTDVVSSLLSGGGWLWMGTNRGIYAVREPDLLAFALDPDHEPWAVRIDREEGLDPEETNGGNQPAAIRLTDGRLLFPTIHGIAEIDPAEFEPDLRPPAVRVRKVRVNGRPVPPNAPIRLEAGSHNLSFEFGAVSLVGGEKVRYRYRLEGYDTGWSHPDPHRNVQYTGIPPGEYTFRLTACNSDGVWNPSGVSVRVSIAPHFYRTPWFIVLAGVAGAVLIFGVFRWRTFAIRRRAQGLSRMVDLRTADLQHQVEERKAAEAALRESEEMFRSLAEESLVGVFILQKGKTSYLNTQMAQIIGRDRAELLGRDPLMENVNEADRERLSEKLARLANGELRAAHFQFGAKRGGDRQGYFEAYMARIVFHGEPAVLGSLIDVTERRLSESALADKTRQLEDLTVFLEQRVQEEISRRTEQERILLMQSKLAAMGEMLGAIAHQWRQPLSTLAMIVQNIRKASETGRLDDAFVDRSVNEAMTQCNFMSRTIEDFRNFLKPAKDKRVFDAAAVARDALSMLEPQLSAHRIGVVVAVDETRDTRVLGEPNELKQALLTLLMNARDSVNLRRVVEGPDSEGMITVTLARDAGSVILSVTDTETGMTPEVLEGLFQPYFSTKDEHSGTGIGLYLARTIVEIGLGGSLTAANGERGAVFTITLPALRESEVPDDPENREQPLS